MIRFIRRWWTGIYDVVLEAKTRRCVHRLCGRVKARSEKEARAKIVARFATSRTEIISVRFI